MNIPDHHYYDSADQKKPRKPLNRRVGFWLTVLVVIILLAYWRAGFFHFSHSHKAAQPLPVVFGTAVSANVPVYLNGWVPSRILYRHGAYPD